MPIIPDTTLLNKYRIVRLLGEGGMARVWLAEELAFGNRLVAIKEPRPSAFSDDAAELELRYRREVQVCAALEQAGVPNIVRAITAEPTGDGLLLVMAYMPGGDLADLIRQHPAGFPVERAVAIALDVLAALAGAHSHPMEIVHRDIKPSNVLFDAQGRAHLADFGLAQLAGMSGRSQLRGNQHPGTPQYMAPEQESSAGYLSPAADLYALGCVLWEMLTGKRYKRVKPGTRPSQMRSEVLSWLDDVVVKTLAEEPWERWQWADEMAAGLAGRMEEEVPHQTELESQNPAEEEAERFYQQGVEHRRQRNFVSAIAALNQAIELDPQRADLVQERGASYHDAADAGQAIGSYERAIADYTKALELDPTQADFHWLRGLSYRKTAKAEQIIGSYEQAIADFSKAIELDPTQADFFWWRGITHDDLEDYKHAIADYSKAIELDPNQADFYCDRGTANVNLENYEQAIKDFSKAIELEPHQADYYWWRGTTHDDLENYEQAIADYTTAIELDPTRAKFYFERGISYHGAAYAGQAIGSYERAIANYTKAIKLDPQRADFYWQRGISYHYSAEEGQAIGSYERAIADKSKAIELDPRRADFYFSRGFSYHAAAYAGQAIGSYECAIADYTKAIELDSAQAGFYYYLRSGSHRLAGKQALGDADLALARELGYRE